MAQLTCMYDGCNGEVDTETMVATNYNDYDLNIFVTGVYCNRLCAFKDLLNHSGDVFDMDLEFKINGLLTPTGATVPIDAGVINVETTPIVVTSPIFSQDDLKDILSKHHYLTGPNTTAKIYQAPFKWSETSADLEQAEQLSSVRMRRLFLDKHKLYVRLLTESLFNEVVRVINEGNVYNVTIEAINNNDINALVNLPHTSIEMNAGLQQMGLSMDDIHAFEKTIPGEEDSNYSMSKLGTLDIPIYRAMSWGVSGNDTEMYLTMVMRGSLAKVIINANVAYEIFLPSTSLFNVVREQLADDYGKLFFQDYTKSDEMTYDTEVTKFVKQIEQRAADGDGMLAPKYNIRRDVIVDAIYDIIRENSNEIVVL